MLPPPCPPLRRAAPGVAASENSPADPPPDAPHSPPTHHEHHNDRPPARALPQSPRQYRQRTQLFGPRDAYPVTSPFRSRSPGRYTPATNETAAKRPCSSGGTNSE